MFGVPDWYGCSASETQFEKSHLSLFLQQNKHIYFNVHVHTNILYIVYY